MNKNIWKIIYYLNWAVIFGFWGSNLGGVFEGGAVGILAAFGRLAGLVAAYMILLQFFFMGRTPYLERVFGLDKLSRIHHTNGQWGFLFLILHPILLIWAGKDFLGNSFFAQTKLVLMSSWQMMLAGAGLLLFITVVVTSINISRRRLKYESWYFVHLLAYLAVFGSFWHQIAIGTDLLSSQVFYWYWIGLYAFVFSNHIVFRFARPIYRFFRHQFFVERVVKENYNTVSIYIGGRHLEKFNVHAGQFMILRFLKKGYWSQAHPFSMSILPDGKQLRVTIKNVGDFTAKVQEISMGTKVFIDGPYGVFTDLFGVSEKVLMIAGGIGITPIRSLMERLLQKGKEVTLLYSTRTEADIVFRREMDEVAAKYGGKVVYVVSDEPGFTGEKGRLDQEKIKALVPDVDAREVFLCGPPPMMEAVIGSLKSLGVSLSKIHFEKFSMG